ncbi:MAG: ABC transporter C-terminal domain-containing protein, partial [Acidobacteriota bacterium]|nr:ABC transporter C-terminal domain-containing protein [Acidobacteriota bacterium]
VPALPDSADESPARRVARGKEDRRQEAEERNRRSRARKDLQQELRGLELEIVELEAVKARDQSQLCDPEILKDSPRVQELMKELNGAELRLKTLLPRWEKLMQGLEELEAK